MFDTHLKFALMMVCSMVLGDQHGLAKQPGNATDMKFLVDNDFEQQLDKNITASWEGASIRSIIRRLAENRKIAIVLDREIDPTIKPNIKIQQIPLREALDQIAQKTGAEVSVLDNVIYLGPPKKALVLKTLVQLRTNELVGPETKFTKAQQFDLLKLRPLHWNDLDEPDRILNAILERYQLKTGQTLPHDLWAAASWPPSDLVQQLSLVLVQFDLTFQWSPKSSTVKLIPITRPVRIERSYPLKSKLAGQRLEALIKQHPDWCWKIADKQVSLSGSIEQHEQVDATLRPGNTNAKPANTPAPLSRQRFTLKLQNVSALALFRKLEQSGISIQYDQQQLRAAGIDLYKKINMNVTEASADEFFEQICNQLELQFSISERAVTLRPAMPAPK